MVNMKKIKLTSLITLIIFNTYSFSHAMDNDKEEEKKNVTMNNKKQSTEKKPIVFKEFDYKPHDKNKNKNKGGINNSQNKKENK